MSVLRASAAQVDLAPYPGLWMTGYARRVEPARGTHDPIMAHAVLLHDGETYLVIVSCDLLGLAPAVVAALRERIARQSPIPAANIMICCTHTHSGPASMPLRGVMGRVDLGWLQQAQDKIVQLVVGLAERLEPARMAFAATTVSAIGFNRQDSAHPTDEEFSILAFDAPDGRAIATILNYATHAVVLGPDNLNFSGDWPAAAAAQTAAARGGVALVLQGACGDVDPVVQHTRGWGKGTHQDTRAIGARLAETALSLLATAPRTSDVPLRVASTMVDVPLDPPPSPAEVRELATGWQTQRAESSDAVERLTAEAMLEWATEMQQALEHNAVPTSLSAEVFAAQIGDVCLVGLPFETYSDIALAIKRALRPSPTLFSGYANGLFGYCPTRWAKDAGGYGPSSAARWFGALLTAIGYGADEVLVCAAQHIATQEL